MISILLPAYKSELLLSEVFCQSCFTKEAETEIVFYDNGGNGDTLKFIAEESEKWDSISVKILGNGKNIGLNAALNQCAKAAKFDYFYLCHTDMALLNNWDKPFLYLAKKYPGDKFLFCSRSIEPHQGHTPFHIISDYGDTIENFDAGRLFVDYMNPFDPSIVTGYRMPFFMHRKLWEKMGGVDESYFSYATDDDLFMTAYDVGVRRFWMVNQSLVYHMQGKSNAQQTVDKDSRKPYEYFEEKWAKKGYNTKQPIDSLLQSLIPWNVKIN